MSFIEVEITTNESEIADEALEKLEQELAAKGVVGWVPNEADLEIIILNTVASMVVAVAQIAAVVPAAIFRKFGTELIKLLYNEGAAATVSTTWTLTDTAGHTIEAGTQLTLGELAFYVESNVVVEAGHNTATVVLVASERGTEYNKLTGIVELVDAIAWVQEVTIIGESTGGANQENDEEYEERLAGALRLQAPRPITAPNFAEFTLDVPSTVLPVGLKVGRATAIDGYNPGTTTFTANTTNKSFNLAVVSSFTGVTAGSILEGVGIPAETTVVSVNTGAKTLVMSREATATKETVSIKSVGSLEHERTVTVFVTNPEGLELTLAAREAIEAWLKTYRELNFLIYCRSANYTELFVTTKIHILPNYVAATVVETVKSAILAYLNPASWANPTQAKGEWLNLVQGYNIVRANKLIGIIEATQGVDYVFPGELKFGATETPTNTADFTLTGVAPLPRTVSAHVIVTSA